MTSNRLLQAIVFATCIGFSPVFAAAPAGLRNKTIHVSYTATTPVKRPDGKERSGSSTVLRTIYVSSLGRAFVKRALIGSAKSHQRSFRETAPEDLSRSLRFEPSRLIMTVPAGANGAQQMIVNFDSSFQTCSVDVKTGSSGGARTWIGLNGQRYTATGPVLISNTRCSIENGNEFVQ